MSTRSLSFHASSLAQDATPTPPTVGGLKWVSRFKCSAPCSLSQQMRAPHLLPLCLGASPQPQPIRMCSASSSFGGRQLKSDNKLHSTVSITTCASRKSHSVQLSEVDSEAVSHGSAICLIWAERQERGREHHVHCGLPSS